MAVDPILYRDGQSFIETDFMGSKKDVRGAEFVAVLKPNAHRIRYSGCAALHNLRIAAMAWQ
jgi:hypothetical protein